MSVNKKSISSQALLEMNDIKNAIKEEEYIVCLSTQDITLCRAILIAHRLYYEAEQYEHP